MNLDDYADKTIHIAFHYTGDPEGKTTSYQIDNIVKVGKDIPTVIPNWCFALYERKTTDGKTLKTTMRHGYCIDDYTSMGTDDGQPGKDYFSVPTVRQKLHSALFD